MSGIPPLTETLACSALCSYIVRRVQYTILYGESIAIGQAELGQTKRRKI